MRPTPRTLRRRFRRNRRGIAPVILGIVIAVVAVVVVVGGLFAAGVLKLNSGGGPSPSATFDVTFSETGLASGTSWTVTLGGTTSSSTTASIVFHMANGTYSFTVGAVSSYTASPASGSVNVNGAAITKAITFTRQATYPVTFTETGLTAGTSWTVSLGGVPRTSTSSSISFSEPNGSYPFTVSAVGFAATPSSGNITLSGHSLSQAIVFKQAQTYSVTFTETGLGLGATWSVTFNYQSQSAAVASIVFTGVTSGTYGFSVTAAGYTASPASGSMVVNGNVTQRIVFTPASSSSVTFTETGLGLGATWSVTFGSQNQSSSSTSIVFTGVASGNYTFQVLASGYTAHPAFGVVNVTTINVTVNITFTSGSTYTVMFTEYGLQFGTSWTVIFNGQPQQSISSSIVYYGVANGTYSFSVNAPGYTASPPSGTITVTTSDVTQDINFTSASTFSVTFTETGLGLGATWSVTLGSHSQSSTSTSIVFTGVASGTYSFSASASGYTASPPSGSIDVTQNASQTITFTSSGGGAGQSYSQVEGAASAVAASKDPSAKFLAAEGIFISSSWTNSTSGFGNSTCTWSGVSTVTVPGTSGSYSGGKAAGWLFIYWDWGTSTGYYIGVFSGSASYLGEVTGAGCAFFPSPPNPLPSSLIDSTQAAADANVNASSYLAAHSSASASFVLIPGWTYSAYNFSYTYPASWTVSYTTCSPSGGGSGDEFSATVNATSGAVTYSSTSTVSCSGGPPIHALPHPSMSGEDVPAAAASPAAMPVRSADRPRD